MKTLLPTLLLVMILATSCSPADGPDNKDIMLADIVTLESVSDANGAVFTFNRYDDLPMITLTAPDYSPERAEAAKIKAGDRALLYYYPVSGRAYTSGSIDVRSLQAINGGQLTTAPLDSYHWNATPVWLTSIWRSGQYINLRLRLSHSDEKRQFCLVADETTLTQPMPELYLVHDLEGQPESYLRDVIASYDISSVWNLASCTGITIHVNDINLKQDIYTFTKQSPQ